jgi:hypothetical protein
METATNLLAALVAATLAALLLVAVASYECGLTAETIRSNALGAAGLLFVTVGAASRSSAASSALSHSRSLIGVITTKSRTDKS